MLSLICEWVIMLLYPYPKKGYAIVLCITGKVMAGNKISPVLPKKKENKIILFATNKKLLSICKKDEGLIKNLWYVVLLTQLVRKVLMITIQMY